MFSCVVDKLPTCLKKRVRGDYDTSRDFEKDLHKGVDFVYFSQGSSFFWGGGAGCHRVVSEGADLTCLNIYNVAWG